MTSYLKLKNGGKIAYHKLEGSTPGIVFLGGFRSNMNGAKALALEEYCKKYKRAFVRFDYEGHGESSGKFEDCTIGRWKENAAAVLMQLTKGRQILVSSSMGGWISLLLAAEKPRRIAAIVGIAAAPDFTESLLHAKLSKNQQKQLKTAGKVQVVTDEDDTYVITKKFLEEARKHLLLEKKIPVTCPVRLIHGTKDEDVPWEISILTNQLLASDDVKTILIENGNHRLQEPEHIKKILSIVDKTIDWLRIK